MARLTIDDYLNEPMIVGEPTTRRQLILDMQREGASSREIDCYLWHLMEYELMHERPEGQGGGNGSV